jgi:hypothetical protein
MACLPQTAEGGESVACRRNRIVAAAVLAISWLLNVPVALAQESYEFDLPEQCLEESLRQIAQLATLNVLFDADSVAKVRAPAIKGVMSANEALEKVLAGTGFTVEAMGSNSVLIRPQKRHRAQRKAIPERSFEVPIHRAWVSGLEVVHT